MRWLRELSRAAKLGALAALVVVGGALGGYLATSGGSRAPVRIVQRASTSSPTTAPKASAPTTPAPTTTGTTTTAPSESVALPAATPATTTGSTPAPTTTVASTPAPTTTTVPARRAPQFRGAGTLHSCLVGISVGVSGGLAGTPHPTGTLSITGGGMSATVSTVGMGTITCTAPPGVYTMTVSYAGDANWLPGTWTFTLQVTPQPSS